MNRGSLSSLSVSEHHQSSSWVDQECSTTAGGTLKKQRERKSKQFAKTHDLALEKLSSNGIVSPRRSAAKKKLFLGTEDEERAKAKAKPYISEEAGGTYDESKKSGPPRRGDLKRTESVEKHENMLADAMANLRKTTTTTTEGGGKSTTARKPGKKKKKKKREATTASSGRHESNATGAGEHPDDLAVPVVAEKPNLKKDKSKDLGVAGKEPRRKSNGAQVNSSGNGARSDVALLASTEHNTRATGTTGVGKTSSPVAGTGFVAAERRASASSMLLNEKERVNLFNANLSETRAARRRASTPGGGSIGATMLRQNSSVVVVANGGIASPPSASKKKKATVRIAPPRRSFTQATYSPQDQNSPFNARLRAKRAAAAARDAENLKLHVDLPMITLEQETGRDDGRGRTSPAAQSDTNVRQQATSAMAAETTTNAIEEQAVNSARTSKVGGGGGGGGKSTTAPAAGSAIRPMVLKEKDQVGLFNSNLYAMRAARRASAPGNSGSTLSYSNTREEQEREETPVGPPPKDDCNNKGGALSGAAAAAAAAAAPRSEITVAVSPRAAAPRRRSFAKATYSPEALNSPFNSNLRAKRAAAAAVTRDAASALPSVNLQETLGASSESPAPHPIEQHATQWRQTRGDSAPQASSRAMLLDENQQSNLFNANLSAMRASRRASTPGGGVNRTLQQGPSNSCGTEMDDDSCHNNTRKGRVDSVRVGSKDNTSSLNFARQSSMPSLVSLSLSTSAPRATSRSSKQLGGHLTLSKSEHHPVRTQGGVKRTNSKEANEGLLAAAMATLRPVGGRNLDLDDNYDYDSASSATDSDVEDEFGEDSGTDSDFEGGQTSNMSSSSPARGDQGARVPRDAHFARQASVPSIMPSADSFGLSKSHHHHRKRHHVASNGHSLSQSDHVRRGRQHHHRGGVKRSTSTEANEELLKAILANLRHVQATRRAGGDPEYGRPRLKRSYSNEVMEELLASIIARLRHAQRNPRPGKRPAVFDVPDLRHAAAIVRQIESSGWSRPDLWHVLERMKANQEASLHFRDGGLQANSESNLEGNSQGNSEGNLRANSQAHSQAHLQASSKGKSEGSSKGKSEASSKGNSDANPEGKRCSPKTPEQAEGERTKNLNPETTNKSRSTNGRSRNQGLDNHTVGGADDNDDDEETRRCRAFEAYNRFDRPTRRYLEDAVASAPTTLRVTAADIALLPWDPSNTYVPIRAYYEGERGSSLVNDDGDAYMRRTRRASKAGSAERRVSSILTAYTIEEARREAEFYAKAAAQCKTREARARRLFLWHSRLGYVPRDAMKRTAATLPASMGITEEDIDLLHWNKSGTRIRDMAQMEREMLALKDLRYTDNGRRVYPSDASSEDNDTQY